MENNEDIKIVEELVCQKYSKRLLNTLSMVKEEDEIYILTIHERQAIENLLSRLKTAERMIELMAEELKEITGSCPLDIFDYDLDCENKCEQEIDGKCWAEYFRNKAKESE